MFSYAKGHVSAASLSPAGITPMSFLHSEPSTLLPVQRKKSYSRLCILELPPRLRLTDSENSLHLAECRSGLSPPHDRSEPITARSRALSQPARTPKEPCLSGRAVTPWCSSFSFAFLPLVLSRHPPSIRWRTEYSGLSSRQECSVLVELQSTE